MRTTFEAIKRAVEQLSPEELAEFKRWLTEFEARASRADRLDQFNVEALRLKGKLACFPPEALADYGRRFSEFEGQPSTADRLDRFAIEALRIKGK
ncbi:MAG: hypothetical protein AAGH67_04245 [Cyanobacteria bacterium P01_H01_bin.162]